MGGRRSTRAIWPALIAGAVVAAACAGVDGPGSAEPPPSTIAGGSADGRFIPPRVDVVGDESLVSITVPDGRRIEVRYPSELDLAGQGLGVSGVIDWPRRSGEFRCCGRVLSIRYAQTVDVFAGDPLASYPGADGEPVPYYDGSAAGRSNPLNSLVFQFGSWMVEVYDVQQQGDFEDPMTEEERAIWARSFDARIDDAGFLVLDPRAPLTVGDIANIVIGPASGPQIEIAEFHCGMPESYGTEPGRYPSGAGVGASWCDADTGLLVAATGPTDFVEAVIDGFDVRWID